jgi:hypothetical protein
MPFEACSESRKASAMLSMVLEHAGSMGADAAYVGGLECWKASVFVFIASCKKNHLHTRHGHVGQKLGESS